MFFHEIQNSNLWLILGKIPFFIFILGFIWQSQKQWGLKNSLFCTSAFLLGLNLGTALFPSILGALGGACFALFITHRFLKLQEMPWFYIAFGLTLLVAIGRFGCLLGGCCFGTPTDLPWALHYTSHSLAGSLDFDLHRISSTADWSLGLHPYPLYESIGLGLWAICLIWLRAKVKKASTLFYLTMAFDLFLRGIIDGMRGMINIWWALKGSWLGLDYWQLFLLCCSLIFGALSFINEIQPKVLTIKAQSSASFRREWTIALMILTCLCLPIHNQTPFLLELLWVAFALIIFVLPYPSLKFALLKHWNLRWQPFLALCFISPFAVMAIESTSSPIESAEQSKRWIYQTDSLEQKMVRVGAENDTNGMREVQTSLHLPEYPKEELVIGVGLAGTQSSYIEQGSCGGEVKHQGKDRNLAGMIEYRDPLSAKTQLRFGVYGSYYSEDHQDYYRNNGEYEWKANDIGLQEAYLISPYFNFENKYAGLTMGLVSGKYIETNKIYLENRTNTVFLPNVKLRFGNYKHNVESSFLSNDILLGVPLQVIGYRYNNSFIPGTESLTLGAGFIAQNGGLAFGLQLGGMVLPENWISGNLIISPGKINGIAVKYQHHIRLE